MARIDGLNEIHGEFFDTINIIQADCSQAVLQEAMEGCAHYHRLLNRFVPGGDLYAINHAGNRWTVVDPDTMCVIRTGLEICEQSGGAFNLCIGPLTRLWNFKAQQPALPDERAIGRALSLCDWRKVELKENAVRIPEGYDIDVGGIAKGFITDRIADFLRSRGARHALLNFGGNIVAIGSRPDGKRWTVGLQSPAGEIGRDFWAAVSLQDESIVTSATYARSFELAGVRYHHLLDSRTGWPVSNHMQIVTVRGKTSVLADGVSTACFVLGTQEGVDLVLRYGMEAVFVQEDGQAVVTSGMNIRLRK